MKLSAFIILLVLVLAVPVWAQEPSQPSSVEVDLGGSDQERVAEPASAVQEAPQAADTVETAQQAPVFNPDGSVAAPSAQGGSLFEEAKQLIAQGEYERAKEALKGAAVSLQGAELDSANDILAEVNYKILMGEKGSLTGVTEYKVKKGDSLYVIAKKHKVTPDFIAKINSLKGTNIRPDQKLRIVSAPFSIKVSKSKNRLELYLGDEILRTYQVSTGTNSSTPTGAFTITTKLVNPTWYKTGAVVPPGSKENILGTRWLGFSKTGYGIHGTTQPELIGTQVTSGCVRMKNEEVEELYALVPSGASVTVVD